MGYDAIAMSGQDQPTQTDVWAKQVAKGCRHLRRQSPQLEAWMRSVGPCKLSVDWNRSLYEALVRAVAHQQLHGRAAETILGRLCDGFRGHAFPSPRQLANAPAEKIRSFGFSTAKTMALHGIAQAALSGQIPDRDAANSMSDQALVDQLLPLRGVGRWTIEMLLIFTLGRLDIMPVDDFGVQSGLQYLLNLKSQPKKADFAQFTDDWQPYRSIAAWYLWRKADAVKPGKA